MQTSSRLDVKNDNTGFSRENNLVVKTLFLLCRLFFPSSLHPSPLDKRSYTLICVAQLYTFLQEERSRLERHLTTRVTEGHHLFTTTGSN